MILTATSIAELLSQSEDVKAVAESYTDIAGSKLLAIRANIERNRSFVAELASVFHTVRQAADRQKISPKMAKKGTLSLALTSNHRFYGGLDGRLMQFYVAHTTISLGDNLVVGTSGRDFLRGMNFEKPFESVVFALDTPTDVELTELLVKVWPYERVLLYYPRMQSVLLQRPVLSEIGGIAQISAGTPASGEYFIFEPELAKMLEFFDRQIVRVLVEQAFLEAELARTAARLVSMEEATRKAEEAVRGNLRLLAQVARSVSDAKNLEMIVPVVARRKETYG